MNASQPKPSAPIDGFSGIPLTMYSFPQPGEQYRVGVSAGEPTIDDHHLSFPRDDLCQTLGGLASRSLIQRVWRADHRRFHEVFGPPEALETDQAQAEAFVWMAAGYVPSQAVDLRNSDRARLIALAPHERQSMIADGRLWLDSLDALKQYLFGFVLGAGLDPDEQRASIRTLASFDTPHKALVGLDVMRQASNRATMRIQAQFAEIWDAGLLPWSPTRDVGEFVCGLLVNVEGTDQPSRKLGRRVLSMLRQLAA